MNVMFAKEINSDDPGARHYDLINPSAMLKNLRSLLFIHYNFAFFLNCFFVSTDSYNEVGMRKKLFGLLKNFSMSYVIHIEDAISIDSHWIVGVSSIGLYLISCG